MRRRGSDCTSRDERSQLQASYIETAMLESQTVMLRRPCALVPATTGVRSISEAQARCTSHTLPSCLAAQRHATAGAPRQEKVGDDSGPATERRAAG